MNSKAGSGDLRSRKSHGSDHRNRMVAWIRRLQGEIVSGLEAFETRERFQRLAWERPGEENRHGGGGEACILQGGLVFEKAGVNISVVEGLLPPLIQEKLKAATSEFFACGISLVIHPVSPQIPTVHANFRFFEQPDRSWFGGGIDLTPYIYREADFLHFHSVLKEACDSHGADLYPQFKKDCDRYFYLPHRGETRGIGGIFFDYLSDRLEDRFAFVVSCGESFLKAYRPLVEKGKDLAFTPRQKKFQLLRRGRYVEFNLLYDRGTLFGLQTKGNSESILMSLPPEVHFDFQAPLETDESEKALMNLFREPRDWV